jgi:hypothetical protein
MKSPSSMKPATERLGCSRTSTLRAWSASGAFLSNSAWQLLRLAQRMRSLLLYTWKPPL